MERIKIKLTTAECVLILNHTFAGSDLTDRLRKKNTEGKSTMAVYSLDELDELAGFIAAEANHSEDKKLEKRLEDLYDKISDIESKYL
ncbi:MAG: hypothetical protein P1P86_15015 [Bacteroidales bacterium]|nr:hypothetical protein [Bacteroidales bacterium]